MDLQELETVAAECQLCRLHVGQDKPVFARGNPEASLVICGMCPGFDENIVGMPFVGRAGKVLDEILVRAFPEHVNPMDYVYVTNLVKCFVKPGIVLEEEWMGSCLPYFLVQLDLMKPKVIMGLGKDVCNYLLNVNTSIGKLRGKIYDYPHAKLVCSYHPSYLSRGGSVKHKDFSKVVDDFKTAVNLM